MKKTSWQQTALAGALIAGGCLLVLLLVANLRKARHHALAEESRAVMISLDSAKHQYAIETGHSLGGLTPTPRDLAPFVNSGTRLRAELTANSWPTDAVGNTIVINALAYPPSVHTATKSALSDAIGGREADQFWGAYR